MQLQYDITVTGEQNVRRALRGVESEINASSKRATSTAAKMPGGATARRSTEREQIAAERRVARESAASTKKSERDQISAAKRVEKERIASERAVAREQQRQEKYWADARSRARAKDNRDQEHAARTQAAASQSFRRGAGATVSNSISGTARTLVGIGGGALGIVGAMGAGEAVSSEIGLSQRLSQVAVNARQSGTSGASPAALRGKVRQASLATGASEGSLIGGLETYTARTGDLKTATDNMRMFGTVAMATGASVEDVASTAADLAQKFNITKPQEMAEAFAVLAFQGKKGAFELRDMANTFPEMAAAAQRMGMKGVGGMKTLGGLAQLARTSTGSGAEASTAVQMMLTQLTMEAGNLKSGKALGGKTVDVFQGGDATKGARDIREVLADVISKSHGNMTQLAGLFDARGVRAASPLISAYREASDAAGGGNKGEAAGRAAVLKAISEASDAVVSFSEVQRDAAEMQKTDAVKIEKINTKLREAFSTSLLPAIERLMPEFERMIPQIASAAEAFAGLASWLISNPFAGVTAAMTAALVKDVGSAMIGVAIKKALSSSIGAGAGIAIASATLLVDVLNWMMASEEGKAGKKLNKLDAEGEAVREGARAELESTGKLSPETQKKLVDLQAQQERRVGMKEFEDPLKNVSAGREVLNDFTGGLTGPTSFNEKSVTQTVDSRRGEQNMDALQQTVALLAEATDRQNKATDALADAAGKFRRGTSDPPTSRTGPIVSR